MDDIEQRLRETTDACIKSFENWVKKNKDTESREGLMETVHELRKVVSRVEIEVALSERERLGSRPLPIPPHRSQMRKRGDTDGDEADTGDEDFNAQDSAQSAGNGGSGGSRRPQGRGRRPQGRSTSNNGNNGNSDSQPS